MRLQINKSEFLKSWQITERSTSSKSTINALTGIFIKTRESEDGNTVLLEATDLKTSIKSISRGVLVEEEGEAVLPVRIVGELFKKAPTNIFTVSVDDGRGTIIAGRNRYKFTTYPSKEFPTLPVLESASFFCSLTASELLRIISEGTVACTQGEEFPKYLGTAFFQLRERELRIISTDGRRLSLAKGYPSEVSSDGEFLLPIQGIKELQRLLGALSGETPIRILNDNTLVFFQMGSIEFSVRRVEAVFPDYEKIMNPNSTTVLEIDRSALTEALERVDIIVRDYTRMVIFRLSPQGDIILQGKAPETGAVEEVLEGKIEGEPLTVAYNVGYLLEGLKALYGENVLMSFNGTEGHLSMLRPDEKNFLYMLMPIKLKKEDLSFEEEERDEPAPYEEDSF
ncbi:DNA polymerase III subunit beta [Aminivibrio sp.]